jgi:hypothetical protein
MPSRLEAAPLNQLAVTLGIAIDKRQLLMGQPNSIQASVYLTHEERVARLDAIFAKYIKPANPDMVNGVISEDASRWED